MKRKCEAILLPTEKGVILKPKSPHRVSMLLSGNTPSMWIGSDRYDACHLYFVTEEEIKNNDHYIWNSILYRMSGTGEPSSPNPLKVVATTNPNLHYKLSKKVGEHAIPDVAKIGDDFLQVYVKDYNEGKPIHEVMLEYEETVIPEDTKLAISTFGQNESIRTEVTLKLRPNGTVIVSEVKEKMYSREEVQTIATRAYMCGRQDMNQSYIGDRGYVNNLKTQLEDIFK